MSAQAQEQIAELAIEVLGIAPGRTQLVYGSGNRGWKGDVPLVRFNCSKIKALGWRAKRSSAEAVRDAMKAMLEELKDA